VVVGFMLQVLLSEEWFRPYLLVVDIEMKELYIDVSEIKNQD
jgi:hypothetical protein